MIPKESRDSKLQAMTTGSKVKALQTGLLALTLAGCSSTQLDPHWEQRYARMDAMVPICEDAGLLNPGDPDKADDYQEASELWQQVHGDSLTQEYRFVFGQFKKSDPKQWPFICARVDADLYMWERELDDAVLLPSAVATTAPATPGAGVRAQRSCRGSQPPQTSCLTSPV